MYHIWCSTDKTTTTINAIYYNNNNNDPIDRDLYRPRISNIWPVETFL